jgi:hypothetical protein
MKIHPVGAELLLHANGRLDRQRDMTQLIIAFHSYVNAATNELSESVLGNTSRWTSQM